MPEEVNRVLTDAISDVLFTTEESAAANLLRENVSAARIHFVGNVMIDCLLNAWPHIESRRAWEDLGLAPHTYGLVTLHRPSNVDDPDALLGIVSTLTDIARRLPLVFPVHPRTRERLNGAGLIDSPAIRLIDPLGYLEFISLVSAARIVITDSGGVQEESTFLHVPCLTLRDNTERPVTISHGTNRLIGSRPVDLARTTFETLARHDPPKPAPPLWDGHASDRIAEVLCAAIGEAQPKPQSRECAQSSSAWNPEVALSLELEPSENLADRGASLGSVCLRGGVPLGVLAARRRRFNGRHRRARDRPARLGAAARPGRADDRLLRVSRRRPRPARAGAADRCWRRSRPRRLASFDNWTWRWRLAARAGIRSRLRRPSPGLASSCSRRMRCSCWAAHGSSPSAARSRVAGAIAIVGVALALRRHHPEAALRRKNLRLLDADRGRQPVRPVREQEPLRRVDADGPAADVRPALRRHRARHARREADWRDRLLWFSSPEANRLLLLAAGAGRHGACRW